MPYRLAMSPCSDSYGNRTRVTAVKGRCLNRLTKEPIFLYLQNYTLNISDISSNLPIIGQVLDRLVTVSSTRYRASTSALSTSSSSRGLTNLRYGISYLEGGFTLRCLQRLSRPHLATQPCHWHDNWCTSGASIPVLSY